MSKLTYAQKFSFSETILEFLRQNKELLEKKGLNVDAIIKKLEAETDNAAKEDAKQEKMKADVVKQTDVAVTTLNGAYDTASNSVDAMVGVLGKKDELSKRLHKLRGQMNRSSKNPE